MDPNRVIIFDTTLRDGEQSPGISLNADREAGDRPAARAPRRRRHRGWLPDRLAGRLRGGTGDRPRGARPGHRRPRARSCRRHRARRGGGARRGAPARCTRSSRRRTSTSSTSCSPRARTCWARRARAVAHARSLVDDVEFSPDGRHPRRRRVHRRGAAGRDRGGRDDDQHPGHRRLHDAERVRRVPDAACTSWCRACATSSCPSTATTTSGWPWRTRSPACRPARARSSARSTASASARATRRSRRS